MKRGYLASRYGYPVSPDTFAIRSLGKLLHLFPLRRAEADAAVRHLKARPQGRLLDVGCGSGEWLEFMQELGWQVEGLDFDQNAVNVARQKGLAVGCGGLEERNISDSSFDAVTLNHVIEHVPDPVQTLKACFRVLKPGGELVLTTPNSSSLGHRLFRRDWRGLEPPRHLHIFSMPAMRGILEQAGFRKITLRPHIAPSVIYESVLLRQGRIRAFPPARLNWPAWIFARLFNCMERCLVGRYPGVADCLCAVAVKE